MNLSHYQWQFQQNTAEIEMSVQQLQAAGARYSPAFLRLCLGRGLNSLAAIQAATEPEPQLFHDAYLLHDMEKAVGRIHQAIAHQEKILIYGDYDADGITSTLILLEALEQMGAQVVAYLPNRHTDGYGPNQAIYEYYIKQEGIQMILTCDNGVAGFEAIAYAQSQGIDVIVSDHHEIQAELPQAYAIIHPRHPQGSYPFDDLSGAGVALKLASALLEEIPIESIELAAIGTVADMVSLTDENRTIVMSGLKLMADTQRIGLRRLLEEAKVDLNKIDVDTIGFVIGPRLNAIGRLADPRPALELLQTFDEDEAEILLKELNQKNQERQALVKQIMAEVEQRLQASGEIPPIIMEADSKWSAGVVGIVASRLTEKYHRPAIILQELVDQGTYKGSGRSVEGLNLFELLQAQSQYLMHFGGHQQAAGLTVIKENYSQLKEALLSAAQIYQPLLQAKPKLAIDLQLKLAEIDMQLMQEIALLGPFGMDNPRPLVACEGLMLDQLRFIGTDQQHVKAKLKQQVDKGLNQVDLLAFNASGRFKELANEQKLTIVGYPEINEWQDQKNIQLRLMDFGIEGPLWIDQRALKDYTYFLDVRDSLFVFSHASFQKQMQTKLHRSCMTMTYQEVSEKALNTLAYKQLVIMEPPVDLGDLEVLLGAMTFERIYLVAYVSNSKYLTGLPTREEFKRAYLWLKSQPPGPFQIKENLPALSQLLKINLTRLKVIFTVFFEMEFVKIEAGWATDTSQTIQTKVDLMQAPSMQAFQTAMEAEAILVYQSLSEINQYFMDKRSQ